MKHNVTMEAIERPPEENANPVMVFESATERGSFVVLIGYKDKGERPVMVAISLSRNMGRGYVVNRVDSAYGRQSTEYMSFVGRGLLRYRNTSKSLDWVRDDGLQLPKAGSPARGFWDSVPTEDGIVKVRIVATTFRPMVLRNVEVREVLRQQSARPCGGFFVCAALPEKKAP